MKKYLPAFVAILLMLPLSALAATPARYDMPVLTTTPKSVPVGSLPDLLAVTNATIHVCGFPATMSDGMCTNTITTYTDSTLATACPSSAQLTAPGTSVCISTTGLQGSFGFWYDASVNSHLTYTVRNAWGTFGPYDILAGASGGGASLPTGTTNQMLYYQAAGNAVTPLNLGSTLNIASGTLNVVTNPLPTPPPGAAHYTNLEVPGQLPGATWQYCTAANCSGGTGTGTGSIATGVNVPGFSSTAMSQTVSGQGTNILAWLKAAGSNQPSGGTSTTGTLTLTVQTPIMGTGSIEIKASASDTTYSVTAIQIYVDGVATPVFDSSVTPPITPIDYTVSGLSPGYHDIVVKAWDNSSPGTQTIWDIPASFGPVISQITNTIYSTDFWIPSTATTPRAIEFDPDIYDGQYEYFLSTQCDSISGDWRNWDMQHGQWMDTGISCGTLLTQTNVKHSISIYGTFNQASHSYTYETLVVDGNTIYQNLGQTYNAAPLVATPSLIVEHQIDSQPSANTASTLYYANTQLWTWGPQSGSGGTVTTVSVASANGFQGTVATPTTTPVVSVNVDGTHYLPTTTDKTTWDAKQGALTLTTTGTSGAATLTGNTLNIPQYSGGGGGSAWSSLIDATSNLALDNGSYTTTFNQTAASNWTWANTTAATSSAAQSSPIWNLCGQAWEGATPANTQDCWTIQNVLANGSNPYPTLTIADSTASTRNPVAVIAGLTFSQPNGGVQNTNLGGAIPATYTGHDSTCSGYNACASATGGRSYTAYGDNDLASDASGTSIDMTAFGANVMPSVTSGNEDIGIGSGTMYSLVTGGNDNIAIGSQAMYSQTSIGSDNIAIGYQAMQNNTNSSNIAIGSYALQATTGQPNNTAIGLNAMKSLNNVPNGFDNVCLGNQCMQNITTGAANVAIGYQAGYGSGWTSSSNNVFVGYLAKSIVNATSGEIVIGQQAIGDGSNDIVLGSGVTSAGANTINIGNSSNTLFLAYGAPRFPTIAPASEQCLQMDTSGNVSATGSPCGSGGSMVYPGAGVPNSTGSAWGTSYGVGASANDLVQLNGSAQLPAVSAANLTNLSGTPALPNGTTATTQTTGDNTAKLATDAFVLANAGTGTVTHTGALTSGQIVIGNGTADVKVDPDASTDGAGNITAKSITTNGGSGAGGSFNATEGTVATAAAGHDILYADSTSHCLMYSANGGSFACLGSSGSGFPITIGSTSIASGSTTTSIAGLTLDGVSPTTFGYLDASSSIQTQLNAKAPLASPALTGAPTAPTATDSTNTTQIATTAFVQTAVTGMTKTIASGTASMPVTAIASDACASVVTVTATGVLTTDSISANPNGDPTSIVGYEPGAMLTIIKYPTAGNVNFKVCNNTGSSITPGAMTLNWRIVR